MNNLVPKTRADELLAKGPIATLCMSNFGELAVYEADPYGDTLVMRPEYGQSEPAPLRWYNIKHNVNGAGFVEYGRHRYYLCEFMRTRF